MPIRAEFFVWSGRWDSNSRPSGPKPDALTGLRYAPTVTGTAHSSACTSLLSSIIFVFETKISDFLCDNLG